MSTKRSSATVAITRALDIPECRATSSVRAASPPLAGSRLLSPEPTTAPRSATAMDRSPAARRKSHHRVPRAASERRFEIAAMSRSEGDARRIRDQISPQCTVRAKMTISATVAIITARAPLARDRPSSSGGQ
jgi:hypothetical protein